MRQGMCLASLLCALFIAAPSQATVLLPDNLVIALPFEGDVTNRATGAASAGALGDAVEDFPGNPLLYESDPNDPGRGQYARWQIGFDALSFNNAAVANIAGSTGFTWSMFFIHGVQPQGTPGWLFNVTGAPGDDVGARINTNADSYRALANQGNFFGGGQASTTTWDHVAFVVEPAGTGQSVARLYINGADVGNSAPISEITNVSDAVIGAWTRGAEWRLDDALMDEFRLYNVAMDASQIAQLGTELQVPEPATMSLMLVAAGLLARRSRHRAAG